MWCRRGALQGPVLFSIAFQFVSVFAAEASYGDLSYWDARYSGNERNKSFEWYGNWTHYSGLIMSQAIFTDDVLMVGCGNSNLSLDMHAEGFHKMTNIDFSKEIIDSQRLKYPHLDWVHGNVRNMQATFSDAQFDVAIDKGAFDAVRTWRKGPEHREMLSEVSRILKPRGKFILITFGTPEQVNNKWFLQNASYGWTVAEHGLEKPWSKSKDLHYVYIMSKSGDAGEVHKEEL